MSHSTGTPNGWARKAFPITNLQVALRLQNNRTMGEVKTNRPFRERFLDGYDRSQLREEVQKVKPKRSLRKKYATWALGGALALGGVGIPMKVGNMLTTAAESTKQQQPLAPPEQ